MNDITAFALMYPNAYSRNPGDIDVWVNASREQITEYAKKHFKLGDDIRLQHLYHHFFDEGIGMRQIIDYFLVVNDFSKNVFLNNDLSNHPVNFSNHPVPLSKEGSTFSPSPSSSGSGDVTAPSRCSEPLRSKVGGASKPFAMLCGMGPPGCYWGYSF